MNTCLDLPGPHKRTTQVLLLHPDDDPSSCPQSKWSLIVDLGRAPESTYQSWGCHLTCPVMSLFDLAEGTDDLHRIHELLECGMGEAVDNFGIDWWDVLAQSIVPQIQQLILLRRLAATIETGADVYTTRPHYLPSALQNLLGGKLITLQSASQRMFHAVRHYADALQQLDSAQLSQVLQDKFDPQHKIRRLTADRPKSSARPFVLLPSAYVNVSRTAVAYAAMLPDVEFLLVSARNNGRLRSLPRNVRHASLDGYFSSVNEGEGRTLRQACRRLRLRLASSAPEFEMAEASGLLSGLENRLTWGLAVRDAWNTVFDSEMITACLCADDSNPYSRLPLIIAKKRGIPALACHHGALDNRMAIKKQHADLYLAKSEMERDYLVSVCRVATERIVTGGPACRQLSAQSPSPTPSSTGWIVFFTEPYHSSGWRSSEVYRELLPKLVALARDSGLELVFKLHPFESAAGQRRTLRRYLGSPAARQIRIITGPTPPELWQKANCAITVQSSVALECLTRGIPIFLCGWLADPCAGYVQQFERFGIGRVLQSPQDLDHLRYWIVSPRQVGQRNSLADTMDPETLSQMLTGTYSCPAAASA
jgi:hypothetical protein